MRIKMENQYGSVFLGGFGSDEFSITQIEGLGFPDVTLNQVQYAGQEGKTTLSASRECRIITISGDIKGNCKNRAIRKAIKVLSAPVEVWICVGNRKRKLLCHCTSFTPSYGNRYYKEFAMQLECDSPYFSDASETRQAIYREEKKLPCEHAEYFGTEKKMISELIQKGTVTNLGDVPAEPMITIINTGGTAGLGAGIVIENKTTGQKITLNYTTQQGETITVNIPERKIDSDRGVNLIGTLSEDSYLSDFWLEEGANEVCVTANSTAETLVAYCSFYNRYLEVMD